MSARPVIGFAGMTHLGINSAVGAAEWGFETVCFDEDAGLVTALNALRFPVTEPDLDTLAQKNRERLTFTADPADLARCDVVYVAPDVPVSDDGVSDLSTLEHLIEVSAGAISENTALVVLSQVPPGFTRTKVRDGLTLYYQVETLIFGRAIERALEPERYIVGCADPGAPLPPAYEAFLAHPGCPILKMRYESAELTKISINLCLVASISTANTLAEVCEHIGADWSEIAPALRLDRRIGAHSYLAPGLGLGGSNLIRDMATVITLGERHDTHVDVLRAQIENSAHRRRWAATEIARIMGKDLARAKLGMLGLAYKENTHSTKNSPALATLAALPRSTTIVAHDPVVEPDTAWHPGLGGAANPLDTATDADALLVMTPWPVYGTLDPAEIASRLNGAIVLDPYRVFDADKMRAAGLAYHTLGLTGGA